MFVSGQFRSGQLDKLHVVLHRVIDGSIMPKIVSGNTNAPIVAMAELGADLIKEEWRTFQEQQQSGSSICTSSQCVKEEL